MIPDRLGALAYSGGNSLKLALIAAERGMARGSLRVGAEEVPMTTLPPMTRHAVFRSRTRRISPNKIEAVLMYGRFHCARGAEVYTLGWREVRRWAERGIDLSRLEGIEVICAHDGGVITVYRNRKPCQARDRAYRQAA